MNAAARFAAITDPRDNELPVAEVALMLARLVAEQVANGS